MHLTRKARAIIPLLAMMFLALPAGAEVSVNLTFDDAENPFTDYSDYSHIFTNTGLTHITNTSLCNWYSCVYKNGSGYLNTTYLTNLSDEGFAVAFWVKQVVEPQTGYAPGYYWWHTSVGPDGGFGSGENSAGGATYYHNDSSRISMFWDWETPTDTTQWYFYAVVYNASAADLYIYQNGALLSTDTTFNLTVDAETPIYPMEGQAFDVMRARYWSTGEFYMDDFVVYNNLSGLDGDYWAAQYDEKKLGTPPDLDIYVKNITYQIPFNFSHPKNYIGSETEMEVCVGIGNKGVTNETGTFNNSILIDDGTTEYFTMSLGTDTAEEHCFNWTTSLGYWKGNITLDVDGNVTEDDEANNIRPIYIPYLNRPYFHFNETEFFENYFPLMTNESGYEVAYDDYFWGSVFPGTNVNTGWTCDDIDPYGKKAREQALSCLYNNFTNVDVQNETRNQCVNAMAHLEHWFTTVDITGCTNAQSIHEWIQVGIALDLMFWNLTEEQYTNYSERANDVCQQITTLPNVRPYADDYDVIQGGNGYGFGSGVGGFCYIIAGLYANNPTVMVEDPTIYDNVNAMDAWMHREDSFVHAYKNTTTGFYQEGYSYFTYTMYHLVENWLFRKKYDLINDDYAQVYQNTWDSTAYEAISTLLDLNYNGDTLRNDRATYQRHLQLGDSSSYAKIMQGDFIENAGYTYFATLTNNTAYKQALLAIRKDIKDNDVSQLQFLDAYLYPTAYIEAGSDEFPTSGIPYVVFDRSDDIFQVRTSFNYRNDTLIRVDGGEERGGGHSQAQGYYLYALGEPFLDYEQVPYEDDVRAETWKNGISFDNDTQTVEGQVSYYNQDCDSAELSQYYGMSSCPTATISEDWPDYRRNPINNTGEVLHNYSTSDGEYFSIMTYRPQAKADTTYEYFMKNGNFMLKLSKYTGATTNESYENMINIYDEFNQTISGNNVTFTRGTKNLYVKQLYTNHTQTLMGGETPINYCFGKTSCASNYRGLGNYSRLYLYTPSNNNTYVQLYHWYWTGSEESVTELKTDDYVGISNGGVVSVMDINGDGITYGSVSTDGWGLIVFNAATVAVNNATYVNNGTANVTLPSTPYTGVLTILNCDYSSYLNSGLDLSCTVDGCSFEGMSCRFSATRTGNAEYKTYS